MPEIRTSARKVREKPIPCPVHTTCDNGDCSIGHCLAEIELRAERLEFNRWRASWGKEPLPADEAVPEQPWDKLLSAEDLGL
jgi:hypothetical protein